MPRRGRPPGRRPHPPRDRSCSTCGENHQGDGAGQLPGYFGHGNLGEVEGPEFYPDPVSGWPNGPERGGRGGRGIGFRGNNNNNANVSANAWSAANGSGFEVWNNGRLVASSGDPVTRGAAGQGPEDFAFDFDDEDYYSDDLDGFGGGLFRRRPLTDSRDDPLGRGPRRTRRRFPPGMEFDDVPTWLFDEFDDDDDYDDDFDTMGPFGGRPPRRRGGGPRRSGGGGGGVRITRHGGAIVVDNEFGGPPRRGGGPGGHRIDPDEGYDDDDDYSDLDDDFVGGGVGRGDGDRVMRLSNGGTLRLHQA
ncbi:hypothetical protein FOPE_10621 [Fonsecaea pedrosoi]|nr:hypothetical protein FOPE_10621 [Fonsecaea pedrosoi]